MERKRDRANMQETGVIALSNPDFYQNSNIRGYYFLKMLVAEFWIKTFPQ